MKPQSHTKNNQPKKHWLRTDCCFITTGGWSFKSHKLQNTYQYMWDKNVRFSKSGIVIKMWRKINFFYKVIILKEEIQFSTFYLQDRLCPPSSLQTALKMQGSSRFAIFLISWSFGTQTYVTLPSELLGLLFSEITRPPEKLVHKYNLKWCVFFPMYLFIFYSYGCQTLELCFSFSTKLYAL